MHRHGLVAVAHNQRIRICLLPLQTRLGAKYLQAQVVFLTQRNLTSTDRALCTPLHTQQHIAVVVQFAPIDKSGQIRTQFLNLQARHKAQQVLCVAANIAKTSRHTGSVRIGSPLRLFVVVFGLCQPTLQVFAINPTYFTNSATAH